MAQPSSSGSREENLRVEGLTRIFLRPIGTPLPLGFLGLAVGTLVVAGVELGWLPLAESPQAGYVLILLTFPAQVVSSVFGFLARDTVAGTGMGILAGSWLTIGVFLLTSPAGSRSAVLGLFLLVAGPAVLVSVVTAAFGKVAVALVMLATGTRFVLTGIYEFHGGVGWEYAAGWTGVALCVIAFYVSLALEVEGVKRRTVLPVLRWGKGRQVIDGGMLDEVEAVEHEPGVREQL